jgi:hypothetical protein
MLKGKRSNVKTVDGDSRRIPRQKYKKRRDSNYIPDKRVPPSYFVASREGKEERKHVLEHPAMTLWCII